MRSSYVAVSAVFFVSFFCNAADAGRLISASSGQKYELGRLVGKGGFGRVYKAWKVDVEPTGRKVRGAAVAIKQYESLATAIAEDEVHRSVSTLPDLPHALGDGFDEQRGKNFLVSRWVTGRTLAAWSRAAKPTTVDLVRSVAKAAAVVEALHARGWLHLDLKPQNVMIDRHGHVTVIDIGIAQRTNEAGSTVATGDGTHEFMAPEQRGAGVVDARADVFSLAGTLYRLVTHDDLIATTNQPGRIAVHLDRIEDPALRSILAKGLAQTPAMRYATASELRAALVDWSALQSKKRAD